MVKINYEAIRKKVATKAPSVAEAAKEKSPTQLAAPPAQL
jgi:hypothetical protein